MVAGARGCRTTSSSRTSPREFGLDESLPIYSGGLGILAGDHLKAASELGVPLVGVGLFYRRGYFRQRLDANDRQHRALPAQRHEPPAAELVPMAPVVELADDDGKLVPVRHRRLARAGRTRAALPPRHEVEGNPDWARDVTDTLYGGDRENRLRQELVLGVGGVRVLRRLGLAPTVFHLNEGHSAFLQLERLRELVEDDGSTRRGARAPPQLDRLHDAHAGARRATRCSTPGSSSGTSGSLVERCGLAWDEFAALGKVDRRTTRVFGLTPFALRTSALRERRVRSCTARCRARCGTALWPDRPVDEVPITSITNGVHGRTWISRRARGPARLTPAPRLRARARARRRA